jgi:hypothetical protein
MKVSCPRCGAVNDYVESGGFCDRCREQLHLPSFPPPNDPTAGAVSSRSGDAGEAPRRWDAGEGWFTWGCLTVGCVLSLVLAGWSLIGTVLWLVYRTEFARVWGVRLSDVGDSPFATIAAGVLGFVFWTGLAIVFHRAKLSERP